MSIETSIKKLTFVRHTSVACSPSICYGQTDVDVAESFTDEAELVKIKLTDLYFDAVYSSPLQRCTKLAAFCGYAYPVTDKRLMELNFGNWEGTAWDEITDPHIQKWYNDWIHTPTTNGESFLDQVERVAAFINDLKSLNSRNILIFAHAGVIRAAAIFFGKIDINQSFSDYKIEYGEIIQFEL